MNQLLKLQHATPPVLFLYMTFPNLCRPLVYATIGVLVCHSLNWKHFINGMIEKTKDGSKLLGFTENPPYGGPITYVPSYSYTMYSLIIVYTFACSNE